MTTYEQGRLAHLEALIAAHDPQRIAEQQAESRHAAAVNASTADAPDILAVVAAYTGIAREHLTSGSRLHEVSRARSIAACLFRDGEMAWPSIARNLGMATHSSAIAARKRGLLLYSADVRALRQMLNGRGDAPASPLPPYARPKRDERRAGQCSVCGADYSAIVNTSGTFRETCGPKCHLALIADRKREAKAARAAEASRLAALAQSRRSAPAVTADDAGHENRVTSRPEAKNVAKGQMRANGDINQQEAL